MRYTLVDMEILIIEEKENPFFKRKDLKVRVKHAGGPTPPKADIIKELASKYDVEEPQVVIDYVFSKRGLGESFVSCKILHEKPKSGKEEPKSDGNEAQASPAA
jgi:ribosomal protein S24E